jgi:hypothetical protein
LFHEKSVVGAPVVLEPKRGPEPPAAQRHPSSEQVEPELEPGVDQIDLPVAGEIPLEL